LAVLEITCHAAWYFLCQHNLGPELRFGFRYNLWRRDCIIVETRWIFINS